MCLNLEVVGCTCVLCCCGQALWLPLPSANDVQPKPQAAAVLMLLPA